MATIRSRTYTHEQLRKAWGAGRASASASASAANVKSDPFVGKWFHTFGTDGEIEKQGRVLHEIAPARYMVQLYEWLAGEPNKQITVAMDDMLTWQFYDSVEWWRASGNRQFEQLR